MKLFSNIRRCGEIALRFGGIAIALLAALRAFNDVIDQYDPETESKPKDIL